MRVEVELLLLSFVPVALAFSHVLGLKWDIKNRNNIDYIRSLTAGLSVAYVFLMLLPELNTLKLGYEPFTLSLLGFSLFHVSHKFIFQIREEEEQIKLLDEIHLLTAGIYNFLIVFSLIELVKLDIIEGVIISAVIISHAIMSELTHAEMQPNSVFTKTIKPAVIILATISGGLLSVLNVINIALTDFLFGITTGAIIYITIREEIPNESRGNPLFFIVGAAVVFLINLFVI